MQTLAQSGFLRALGWSLVSSLWQMSLLWVFYFVLTVNSRKFSATVRHSIAILLLGAGIAWFIFTFCYYYTTSDSKIVFSVFISGETSGLISFFNGIFKATDFLLPYGACMYLFVLAFQIVKYSKYFFHSQQLVNDGLHRMNPQLRMFADEIARRLGIQKKVQVFFSDIADSPMTIGFLKYIILIPIATINNLSAQQVEAILLHELAHIKRNDYLLNLVIAVVEMLFFFNPFCRLFINVIKRERENSCDDLVIQFKYDPHVYVTALLSLEKSRHSYHPLAMAATGKNNKFLLQRVRRITGQPVAPARAKPRIVLLFLFFIAVGGIMQLRFTFLPKAFHAEIAIPTSKKDNTATSEMKNVVFSSSAAEKNQSRKSFLNDKPKKDLRVSSDENIEETDQDVTDASSGEAEDPTNDNVVAAADQTESADFSISPQKPVEATPEISADSYYPYVPKASYHYEVVTDSSIAQKSVESADEPESSETMEKSLKALGALDWKKIENDLKSPKTFAVNIKKLKLAFRKTLANVDWEKMNKNIEASAANDADAARINNDLQIQIEALGGLKSKSQLQAQKLEEQILLNKVKLQQNYLQKQLKALKKGNGAKRTSKIVYI